MALPPEEERLSKGLLDAARSGDLVRMKVCERLDRGQGLLETYTKYRDRGQKALILGAAGGRTNICKYLVEVVGLDVNNQDSKASQGKKEAARVLLDNNANPNPSSGNAISPLLMSIVAGSHECINLLLKAGADPDLGVNIVTPLQTAIIMEDTEAIKCLLKAGANPNATDLEGITPLEMSAFRHYYEGVEVLLPKTNPIPSIRDWTPRGVISSVHSQEAKYQVVLKKDIFMESKTKAAEALKKKDYLVALYYYNLAIFCDPLEATMFSNRSMCYARLNEGFYALEDAEACIALKPDWSKAHYRKGEACEILKDFRGATGAYVRALKLEPGNVEIETALRKVIELLKASMD